MGLKAIYRMRLVVIACKSIATAVRCHESESGGATSGSEYGPGCGSIGYRYVLPVGMIAFEKTTDFSCKYWLA